MFTTALKPKEPVEIILSEFAIITGMDQEKVENQLVKLIEDLENLCYQNNIDFERVKNLGKYYFETK